MKKITILMTLILAFSFYTIGQVTITSDNFPREHTFIDSFYSSPNPSTIALPSEGAEQVWDYSNVSFTISGTTEYSDASSDPDVSGAFSITQRNLTFQGFPIESYSYDQFSNDEWYLMAERNVGVGYSITNISGGVDDSIFFPEYVDIYDGQFNQLTFPLTYQSNWSGERIETTPFILNVDAFGLNNAPGTRVRTFSETRDVVGYGKLTIPNDAGNPSNELDVLLIKSSANTIDSFFLGGNPAPAMLLDAFSLTQGMTSSFDVYLFYMPNFGSPVMRFGIAESGTEPNNVTYRPAATRVTTSVKELRIADAFSFYPNPVTAGSTISINFNEITEEVLLKLTDLSGRLIHSKIANASTGSTQFEIPEIASGVYLLKVSSENGELISSSKILIK